MRSKINILIVDDNIEFGDLLKEYISQHDDLNVVGVARDGLQAIDMIKVLAPDIVILDIIMPNLDGIGVLEKMQTLQLGHKTMFIILSAIGQDMFIQKAISLGAEYYIVKPFDVDVLISRVRQIYDEKYITPFKYDQVISRRTSSNCKIVKRPQYDLEVIVTNLMRDLGIPPHIVGYQYLREAIIQAVNDPKIFGAVTKILYPSVAKKYGVKPQKVERSIRNAIENTWLRGNTDSMDSLFGYTINYNRGKPTNSEFIAMLVDKTRSIMKQR